MFRVISQMLFGFAIKVMLIICENKGPQIFQKILSHPTILGTTRVTWTKFHIDYPYILGRTIQSHMGDLAHRVWTLLYTEQLKHMC